MQQKQQMDVMKKMEQQQQNKTLFNIIQKIFLTPKHMI